MRNLLVVLAIGVLVVDVHGQTPADPAPTFEVASVRPNKSGSPNNNFGIQGDTFTATNGTLRELIRVAYGAREMELSKGQEWIESERFDIVAKARAQLKPARVPDELKQLLAERFGLKVHNETREVPIYALMVARTDGKLGTALQPLTVDRCAALIAQAMERSRKGQPPLPPVPGQRIQCGMHFNPGIIQGASIWSGPSREPAFARSSGVKLSIARASPGFSISISHGRRMQLRIAWVRQSSLRCRSNWD